MANFIEVCAGAGGLSSGLIKAGFTPLLLNDFDKVVVTHLSKTILVLMYNVVVWKTSITQSILTKSIY